MGQIVQLRTRNLTSPSHPAFVPYRRGGPARYRGGLGALGLAPVGGQIVAKAGGTAAGAVAGSSTIAAAAGYGAVAGPVGIVVGAIVGLALSALLTKNYLNVAQADAGEDQCVQAFNQYRTIAGTVAGRQIGFNAMTAVLQGAVYSGVFPLNNKTMSFHEGNLKYPGDGDWPWGVMNNGANNPYTMAWAMQQYAAVRSQNTGGVPDAVVMVDQFFIPSNTHDSPAWAVPSNATAHQLLYDCADAYLAQNGTFTTTPFVASSWNANQVAQASAPTQVAPAASSTTLPYVVPTSASTFGTPPVGGPVQTQVTAAISASNNLNPLATPQLSANQPPVNSPPGVVTTTTAATSANLDAALAAQGYARVGTTSAGFPLYSSAGQVYAYQNGQLYPFGSVAQLAATGNAGSGISTPTTGLDPNTLAAIQAAVAQGMSATQAAQGAALNLQAQGVPITTDTATQIANAANSAAAAPSGLLGSSSGMLLLAGGAVLLFVLLRRK